MMEEWIYIGNCFVILWLKDVFSLESGVIFTNGNISKLWSKFLFTFKLLFIYMHDILENLRKIDWNSSRFFFYSFRKIIIITKKKNYLLNTNINVEELFFIMLSLKCRKYAYFLNALINLVMFPQVRKKLMLLW